MCNGSWAEAGKVKVHGFWGVIAFLGVCSSDTFGIPFGMLGQNVILFKANAQYGRWPRTCVAAQTMQHYSMAGGSTSFAKIESCKPLHFYQPPCQCVLLKLSRKPKGTVGFGTNSCASEWTV